MDLKLATWNVEWMVSLFGAAWTGWDGTMPDRFPGASLGTIRLAPIADVPALAARIAGVIRAVDPDILCIQEGPPREEQMQHFVDAVLGGGWRVFGSNRRWQRLYLLVRDGLADRVSVDDFDDVAVRARWLDQPYYPWGRIAADDRGLQDAYRRPLAFLVRPGGPDGPVLHGLNVHTKSKFSKLKSPEQWENRDPEAVLDALLQRQKLSAEIRMVRRYVEGLIAARGPNTNICVLGDFNDGPAASLLEREFLIHNIVDELAGTLLAPDSRLVHGMNPAELATAHSVTFRNPLEGGALVRELIDHVMISVPLEDGSAGLGFDKGACVVETAAWDAGTDLSAPDGDRMRHASDHMPVSALITV